MSSLLDRVKRYLRNHISSGKLAVGTALPAPEVLAGRMKCSPGTVRKACIDLANEGMLKRIKRRGTVVARKPRKGRVCVLLAHDSHTNELLENELYRALLRAQYDVDLVPTSLGVEFFDNHCRRLLAAADPVDCLIALEPVAEMLPAIENLAERFSRKVLFHFNNHPILPHTHLVTLDHRQAAREVVEHLLKLGHRRIAVNTDQETDNNKTWSAESGAHCKDLIEIAGGTYYPFFFAHDIERLGRLFKRERVTAYWAMHDYDAVKTVNFCNEQGLRVPRDISIVGRYDTPWSRDCRPQLTTVSINPQRIAAALVEALGRPPAETPNSSQPIVIKVAPVLIVRASTRAVQCR